MTYDRIWLLRLLQIWFLKGSNKLTFPFGIPSISLKGVYISRIYALMFWDNLYILSSPECSKLTPNQLVKIIRLQFQFSKLHKRKRLTFTKKKKKNQGEGTRSHKCIWSNGKTPFSGGTGRAPLFPPNAPPEKKWIMPHLHDLKR